jgi:hypothetical protein
MFELMSGVFVVLLAQLMPKYIKLHKQNMDKNVATLFVKKRNLYTWP